MNVETVWQKFYVALSRCRKLENILIVNAPENLKTILENGPPAHLIQEMKRLRWLDYRTRAKCARAREYLDLPRTTEAQPEQPALPRATISITPRSGRAGAESRAASARSSEFS